MSENCLLHQWLLGHLTVAMKERGVTQVEMAREAGISQKHLSRILTGKAIGSLELWDFLLLCVGVRHKVLSVSPTTSPAGPKHEFAPARRMVGRKIVEDDRCAYYNSEAGMFCGFPGDHWFHQIEEASA